MNTKRVVLLVSILASCVAFLDSSVITVALPAISRELGGGLFLQQWVADAYFITLGSLILIGGSLGDVFGQRRMLRYGLLGFGCASLLCAVAPEGTALIVLRAIQGIAGAVLEPASLALIIAAFPQEEQGAAIGSWTAWTGMAFLIGPLLGGALVDHFSWRLIFIVSITPALAALWLMRKITVAEIPNISRRVDYLGAVLCGAALLGIVFALIEEPHFGWSSPAITLPLLTGIAALAAFFFNERANRDPMLPLGLFSSRNFLYGNIATFAIYAALSIATFLISIFLQQVGGFSALAAGLSLLPVTLIMFLFSSRFGALSNTYGPRLFMTAGPMVAAFGFLLMSAVTLPVDYWGRLLPGVICFGIGLSITVAPLTAAVLGSVEPHNAGIGSAINNAIASIAGLIGIAFVGAYIGGALTLEAFRAGAQLAAGLLVLGGFISLIGIRNPRRAGTRPQ